MKGGRKGRVEECSGQRTLDKRALEPCGKRSFGALRQENAWDA